MLKLSCVMSIYVVIIILLVIFRIFKLQNKSKQSILFKTNVTFIHLCTYPSIYLYHWQVHFIMEKLHSFLLPSFHHSFFSTFIHLFITLTPNNFITEEQHTFFFSSFIPHYLKDNIHCIAIVLNINVLLCMSSVIMHALVNNIIKWHIVLSMTCDWSSVLMVLIWW